MKIFDHAKLENDDALQNVHSIKIEGVKFPDKMLGKAKRIYFIMNKGDIRPIYPIY